MPLRPIVSAARAELYLSELSKCDFADLPNAIRSIRTVLANLERLMRTDWERRGAHHPGIKPLNESNHIFSKPFPGRDLLTERECAVLRQIVKGATSREAAHALGISHRTVEFHRANILQKLGAKNTIDLVRLVLGSH